MKTDDLSDIEILARTAYGECRGGGQEGMQSVINVICNRANSGITWWGDDIRSVCLKFRQFSCWLPNDPNYNVILNISDDDITFRIALGMAHEAFNGVLPDITKAACYYISKSMGDNWPGWAKGHQPCADIAGQLFFNDID